MDTPVATHADRRITLGRDDGLTDDHVYEVARLVRALPGRWFVERCEDDFGFVSVLVVQDVEGADGLIFAVSRLARGINLDLCLGGHIGPLGTFGTIARAMERVMDHVRQASAGAGRGGTSGGANHRGRGTTPPEAAEAPGRRGHVAPLPRDPAVSISHAGFERVADSGLPGVRCAVRAWLGASRAYGRFGGPCLGQSSLDGSGTAVPVAAPGGRFAVVVA